jgi:quercetin dioxygenase-like cupin family protein
MDMHAAEATVWASLIQTILTIIPVGATAVVATRMTISRLKRDMLGGANEFLTRLKVSMMAAVDKASADDVYTLDLTFRNGKRINIPVIVGRAVPIWPGVTLTGISSNKICSRYMVVTDFGAEIPEHIHEGCETVRVVEGVMIDLLTGHQYRAGEVWELQPGEWHKVFFEADGVFEVCIKPPLKLASVQPIDVEAIASL